MCKVDDAMSASSHAGQKEYPVSDALTPANRPRTLWVWLRSLSAPVVTKCECKGFTHFRLQGLTFRFPLLWGVASPPLPRFCSISIQYNIPTPSSWR